MGRIAAAIQIGLVCVGVMACNFSAQAQTADHTLPETLEDTALTQRTVTEARLDAALESLLSDDTLQTERPEWIPPARPLPEPRKGPGVIAQFFASLMRIIGPILGYLMLALIVIVILIGLFFMFGESLTLRRRQKARQSRPLVSENIALKPDEGVAKALLEDADALAVQGRFAEAVHMLLFRSINDIQNRRQGLVTRALTAREIGELESLPAVIRTALSPIIGIVERSFFGGYDVDQANWETARQSYEAFAFGEAWT